MRTLRLVLASLAVVLAAGFGSWAVAQNLDPPDDPVGLLVAILHEADSNHDGRVNLADVRVVRPGFPEMTFHMLDRNNDGFLSAEDLTLPQEAMSVLLHIVNVADADHDGRVSLADIRVAFPFFPEMAFHALDRNQDLVLSKDDMPPPADVLALLIRLLGQADTNHDGDLTLAEIRNFMPGFPENLFERLDRNHDGVVSRDDIAPPNELLGLLTRLLKEADANHDGQVTLAEARALIPDFPEQAFDRLDRNKDGVLSQEDLPPPPPPDDPVERLLYVLREADADGDGEVTFDEVKALVPNVTQEQFDKLDRNKDGVLSRGDLPSEPPIGSCERLLRLLREADANYDGQVTFDELKVVVPDLTQLQFDTLDREPPKGVLTKEDLPGFDDGPEDRLEDLLRAADADGDGKITFEELQAVMPNLTQEQFNRLDVNDDGFITRGDLPKPPVDPIARLIQLLKKADANDDGQVTFDELKAVAPDLTQEQFNKLDRNEDGVITKEDLPDRPPDPREWLRKMLREADANHDGQVTFDELKAKLPELTQERFDQLDRNDDGVLTKEDIPDRPIPPDDSPRVLLLRALMSADTNHDGELDFTEIAAAFPDAPSELLAEIDTNHDWVITRGELRAALASSIEGRLLIKLVDLDADGLTNAIDIQSIINQALLILGNLLPADLNGDFRVDAIEVQSVINGALGLK